MNCRFEPASSAQIDLYTAMCGERRSAIDEHAACLANYTESSEGRGCTDPIRTVDVLASDAPHTMCAT
jgi:hypothetical protein